MWRMLPAEVDVEDSDADELLEDDITDADEDVDVLLDNVVVFMGPDHWNGCGSHAFAARACGRLDFRAQGEDFG